MTEKEFQKEICLFLDKNPKGDLLLAKECEIAISTVHRWANGTAKPHPRMREWILSWTR